MEALVTIHEHASPVRVTTTVELDAVLRSAADEARARRMLNVIFIQAKDRNTISMVGGGGPLNSSVRYSLFCQAGFSASLKNLLRSKF